MSLASDITRARGGDWHGNQGLIAGPRHSAKDRSLSVRDTDDGLDVVLYSFAGDDWRPVKDELRAAGLIPDRPAFVRSPPVEPRPARATPPVDASKQRSALRLWSESVEPGGTVVERYLAGRALRLPMDTGDVLRFHPACPFGDGVRVPCMVALMRDFVTDEPRAIHRTALTPDGQKAFGSDSKKMLGPARGAVIKLAFEAPGRIGIAEGIETGLSVIQAGWTPVWAAGSAGGIEALPVLPYAELTVFADPGEAGQAAAIKLATRWAATGQSASVQTPARGDFNDALAELANG